MKRIIFLGFVAIFFLIFVPLSHAAPDPSPSSSPSANINSFEMFWPLVAGKTTEDPLYFLKTLKENIRELFIFGGAQRADYLTFISTKRFLEAEKLLGEKKDALAIKTISDGIFKINAANLAWNNTKKEDRSLAVPQKDNITKQLSNLDAFLIFLSKNNQGEVKSKLDEARNKVTEFQKSL